MVFDPSKRDVWHAPACTSMHQPRLRWPLGHFFGPVGRLGKELPVEAVPRRKSVKGVEMFIG